jgi:hypothetical protein
MRLICSLLLVIYLVNLIGCPPVVPEAKEKNEHDANGNAEQKPDGDDPVSTLTNYPIKDRGIPNRKRPIASDHIDI